jgi:hypothetical protein
MEIEIKTKKTVKPKLLKLHLKVSDMFTADLLDEDGSTIHGQDDGYVPKFMPGQHYGDYVILDIDITTGQVVNWKTPTPQQLAAWVDGGDDA